MIDLGIVKGRRTFYTGQKSVLELIGEGVLVAFPDAETGFCLKRAENVSEVERRAAYTLDEVKALIAQAKKELGL